MGGTVKESAVSFQTTSPLFNYSLQYGYPLASVVGLIPACGTMISETNPYTIHTISVNHIIYSIEIACTTQAQITDIVNQYVNSNIDRYSMYVTNSCGFSYNTTYDITPTDVFPINLFSYIKDNVAIIVNQVFYSAEQLDAFMESIGWTVGVSKSYEITSNVKWGNFFFKLTTLPLDFYNVPVLESVESESTDIEKINTVERCPTSYGFLERTCIWGSTGASYLYWALLTPSTPDTFLADYFPQTGVEFTVNGVTTTKDFADVNEFIDYMASLGWVSQTPDYFIYLFDITNDGWNSIVFTSGDVAVEIQQYVSKLDLEETCTDEKIFTQSKAINKPLPPIFHTLVKKVEKNIATIACQEFAWRKIGKPTDDLYRRRVINLNAKFLLDLGGLTLDQLETIDCFVEANAKP